MAEVLKKQRKSNFSQNEVETILRAVSDNYETLYGEYSKKAVNKIARHKAWLDVTNEVNQVSNEKRTLQEVKNKWKKCQHLYRSDDLNNYSNYNDAFDVTNVWEPLTEIEDEDSMPLQERIRTPSVLSEPTEPVLQSQPLSPTKLKVTRQTKPYQPSPKIPSRSPSPTPVDEICLRWNSHHANMQNSLPSLLLREQYVDATLVAEGQTIKCHRVILSSCSPYFEEVLASISPYQHPVLFMKDVPFWVLKTLCDFMYAGEVHIFQNRLEELLEIANNLKIKGLSGKEEVKDKNLESPILIKDDYSEEIKRKEDNNIKNKKRECRDLKKREEKELKKKEDKEIKREIKKKDEKDLKKKDDVKLLRRRDDKEKQKSPEMPLLKSAKAAKISHSNEMPVLKSARPLRNQGNGRRTDKKLFDKEKIDSPKDSPQSKKYLDPLLDLLKPVYEEVEEETKPVVKEIKNAPVRRSFPKKVKKRKISERDESPPPVITRKGTRSRPLKKVAKFEEQSTIVREPHTSRADPLMNLQCIKSEPIYEDSIEIDDTLVDFNESSISVEEHIIESYDESSYTEDREGSKNIPIIMDIHSMENDKGESSKLTDPLEDPLTLIQANSTSPIIVEASDNTLGFRISQVITEKDDCTEMGFHITNVVSAQDPIGKSDLEEEEIVNQLKEIKESSTTESFDNQEIPENNEPETSQVASNQLEEVEASTSNELEATTLNQNDLDIDEKSIENDVVENDSKEVDDSILNKTNDVPSLELNQKVANDIDYSNENEFNFCNGPVLENTADSLPTESCSTSEPVFQIAQVVSEQTAGIEGGKSDNYNECSENNYNEFDTIVNDLSKIVGDSCSGLDEVMDDSIENLLKK